MKLLELSRRRLPLLCLLTALSWVAPTAAVAAEASYSTIQVPGALGTYPMTINNTMTVTGFYTTSPTSASAFIRDPAGTITSFSIDGSLWTEPESINDGGDITGFYEAAAGVPESFIRYANGRVVTFDPPEDPCSDYQLPSKPFTINKFGQVAGNYYGSCFNLAGFTRSRTELLDFDVYDDHLGADYPTGFFGLNSDGTLVGFTEGGTYGLFVHADGYTRLFSVPPIGQLSPTATIPEAINDTGVIAGWYYAASFSGIIATLSSGGFVRSPEGDFTLFNPPGTLVAPVINRYNDTTKLWSAPKSLSLNAAGFIAGTYTDASGTKHGFVRNPYGTITPFDPPQGMQTTATSINDLGVIAGSFYYDWNPQTSIGYLRIPAQ